MIQKNKIQNNILEVPEKCICEYQPQIYAYKCQFDIKNVGNQTVYLNINSTLVNYMQIDSFIPHITPGQKKKIFAKLRPPNQIYDLQFIGISYSFIQKIDYLSVLNDDNLKSIIKLQFITETNQDSQIDAILNQCSNSQLQQAEVFMKKNQFKNAINKSEEAFTLYRKNFNSLILIAEGQLKLGNYLQASRKVDLLFYLPNIPEYLKAVVIKSEVILSLINKQQFQGKLQCIKKIMKLLKKNSQNDFINEIYEKRIHQIMARYQNFKHELISMQQDGQFHELLQKSIEEFENHEEIKKNFLNKEQFQIFIKKLMNIELKNQNQTPQYALDPVNYEIFQDPVITPAGVSYEKKFMINFLKKNGHQDPLTRTYLDFNSVVDNITLKILVRNNPNLSKWIKFEQEASKF